MPLSLRTSARFLPSDLLMTCHGSASAGDAARQRAISGEGAREGTHGRSLRRYFSHVTFSTLAPSSLSVPRSSLTISSGPQR